MTPGSDGRRGFVAGMGSGLLIGLVLGLVATAAGAHTETFRQLAVFAEALAHIQREYVTEPDPVSLVRGAIRGMVQTLDPYSVYMPPEIFREVRRDAAGRFVGVGLEIAAQARGYVVVAPIDGSPAARAGIKAGDRLLEVDDRPVEGLDLFQVLMAIRGQAGTKVRLLLETRDRLRSVELTREQIQVESVKGRLIDGRVAYVRITTFAASTARSVIRTMDRLQAEAEGALGGVILDLRHNPGGLLEQAVEVVDEFLDQGVIVTTQGRFEGERDRYLAHPGARSGPVVVLVDRGSASASEIVAGALQDHRRAPIVGQRTFGKGTVQTIDELSDGAGLKLTVARYLTPSGRNIHGRGIEPDLALDRVPRPGATPVERDLAVQAALRAIRVHSEPSAQEPEGGRHHDQGHDGAPREAPQQDHGHR